MPSKGESAKIDWQRLQEFELHRPPYFPFPPIYDPVPWWIFKEDLIKRILLEHVQYNSQLLKANLEHNERMEQILKAAKF